MHSRIQPFESWMVNVDIAINNIAHVSYLDIPDFDYYASFEAGESPDDVAREALEAADFPFDEEEEPCSGD